MSRAIKTKPSYNNGIHLSGWYNGKHSYLWIGKTALGPCLGYISGQKLYRLAKTIVKEFERARN